VRVEKDKQREIEKTVLVFEKRAEDLLAGFRKKLKKKEKVLFFHLAFVPLLFNKIKKQF
jgi:hypothetical protein